MAKQKDLLEQILSRWDACDEHYSNEYVRADEDSAFLYGQQWTDEDKKARSGRPCLTENRLLPYKHQVLNAIKQADMAIKVSPVDDEADPETADIIQGIIRNIEVQSRASEAYDTGADRAIDGGYGFIRVNTRYADYKSFDKEIYIDRVVNPRSVYIDPQSIALDGSDAKYAFVFDTMTAEEFEAQYPNAKKIDFKDKDNMMISGDKVCVAEYYYKSYEYKTLVKLATGEVMFKDEAPEGSEFIDTREVEICSIKWVKTNGQEILDETDIEGEYIPVIPVYGEEAWLDNRRKVFSLIHQAKDPQRALNYWKSTHTELIALQPKSPYIGAVGSFESRVNQWKTANTKNPAFLEYDPVIAENGQIMPPPGREQPPTGSPAMLEEVRFAVDGIKASLGMHDETMGTQGSVISGEAIKRRQLQGDNATFHFADNLAASICHVGRVIVSMIPSIYDGERIMRIVGADGSKENVPVNQPYVKTEKGFAPYKPDRFGKYPKERPDGIFKLDVGKYDVVCEVGSSYATKRQEAADMLIEIAKAEPRLLEVAADILIKNLDIPDSEELVKRIRAVMDPAVLGDDPQAAKLQAAAQSMKLLQDQLISLQMKLDEKTTDQKFKNELEVKKLELQSQEIAIEAAKTQAEIQKMQAETGGINADMIAEVAGVVSELLERADDTEQAVNEIISAKEMEATSQPRGLISRFLGRNPKGDMLE